MATSSLKSGSPIFRRVLQRASEMLREEGVRGLWFKLLGETVYRRVLLLERPLEWPPRETTARSPVVISLLRTTETAEYCEFRGGTDISEIRRRLEAGHLCFVARHQGRLVAVSWAATHRAWIYYLSCDIQLAPDEVYVYDSFTTATFRGQNIRPVLVGEILRHFRVAGYCRMVAAVRLENRAILRSAVKTGYRPYGRMGYVKLGPWRRNFYRVGKGPS